MLGLGDFWVSIVFVFCVLSTVLCVVYGAVNWNKDGVTPGEVEEKKRWEKDEREIEDKI